MSNTNLPTPAEVAELRRLANGGFTQAIDPDRVLVLLDAVALLREVAEIADELYAAEPYSEGQNTAESRWLAVRDKVLGRESP